MKSWSIFGGRFYGVEFRVHVTFVFLLAYFLLPFIRNGDPNALSRGFVLCLLVLSSVFLRELGHALVGARNGLPIKASILMPIGAIALTDPNARTHGDGQFMREVRVATAGLLVNAFLAGAAGLVLLSLAPLRSLWTPPLVAGETLVKSFFWINIFLLALNLLPAFPLDGGRMFRAWLARSMDYQQATRRAVTLGQFFVVAFMLGGVKSQESLMVGLFLFLATQMEERTAMFQSVAEAVRMEDVMLTHFSTLSPADTLEDALSKAVHSLQDDFPVVSGSDLVGVINRQIIVERLRREGNGYVQGAMNKAFEIASRSESLASAFRKLTTRGLTLIPVVDQERLVGIVTLQNLMHSMGLLAESRRLKKQGEDQL
jgi:Zn-dependent protease